MRGSCSARDQTGTGHMRGKWLDLCVPFLYSVSLTRGLHVTVTVSNSPGNHHLCSPRCINLAGESTGSRENCSASEPAQPHWSDSHNTSLRVQHHPSRQWGRGKGVGDREPPPRAGCARVWSSLQRTEHQELGLQRQRCRAKGRCSHRPHKGAEHLQGRPLSGAGATMSLS